MASPLMQLPWDACLLQPVHDRRIESFLKREAGSAPGWSRYFWSAPWFAKAAVRMGFESRTLVDLDFDLAHLVALAVSRENSCRYCYAVARAMLRMLGMNEAQMQDLERRLSDNELDPRVMAAIRFARVVNRGNPLDGRAERETLLRAGFSTGEIRELAFVVISMGLYNRLSTIAALPPEPWENAPDHWAVQLCRPLIGGVIRRFIKPGKAEQTAPPPSPLAPALIGAYHGSPIARVLAESLHDLWAADRLTKREKLLMLATIARGIECEACRENVDGLASHTGVDPATLRAVVVHLDDPELDPRERALMQFARESLWYEPQPLQRRARVLLDLLGAEPFVEVVAVVTIANALARLIAAMADSA
jgi:AhpD family alkylhydroperoxidase